MRFRAAALGSLPGSSPGFKSNRLASARWKLAAGPAGFVDESRRRVAKNSRLRLAPLAPLAGADCHHFAGRDATGHGERGASQIRTQEPLFSPGTRTERRRTFAAIKTVVYPLLILSCIPHVCRHLHSGFLSPGGAAARAGVAFTRGRVN